MAVKKQIRKTSKASTEIPPLTDEHSYNSYNKSLRQESQRRNPNKIVVEQLMAQTYQQRRQMLESKSIPVKEIIEENPFLGREKEVSKKQFFISKYSSIFQRSLKS